MAEVIWYVVGYVVRDATAHGSPLVRYLVRYVTAHLTDFSSFCLVWSR